MLLKRPFAFLIKHFKLIHLILCVPIFYLLYRSNLILGFITEYLQSTNSVIGSELTSSLFDVKIIISIAVIIVGSFIIMALMSFKNKPVTFYFYNLFVYIALATFYMFSYSIIGTMEVSLVDVRTIKIIQDLSVTAIILQFISSIMFTIRATGFDIKKFDFRSDLEDLKIETADSEEFEIDTQFDTDEVKRKFRNLKRNAKYVYKENKLLVNLVALLIIGLGAFLIYNNSGIYSKKYDLSVAISTEKFVFNIKDNYMTSKNYRGGKITENSLVIIGFDIKSISETSKLDISRFSLIIGDDTYKSINKYNTELVDLGTLYENQEITSDFSNYILAFEIPNDKVDETKILTYRDYNNKQVRVKLNPINLDNVDADIVSENIINFEGSLLDGSELILDSFEINDKFKLEYNYCLTNGECYKSYEYVSPSYSGSYDKALLKIKGSFNKNETFANEKINNIKKLITTYGRIEYIIANEEKYIDLKEFVNPKNVNDEDTFYVEVNREIMKADSIVLKLNIRNKRYSYIIK